MSISSESLDGETVYSDEPDAPSRQQIARFTNPDFREGYEMFLKAQQHLENEGELPAADQMMISQNPSELYDYLECHRFELVGFRFNLERKDVRRFGIEKLSDRAIAHMVNGGELNSYRDKAEQNPENDSIE